MATRTASITQAHRTGSATRQRTDCRPLRVEASPGVLALLALLLAGCHAEHVQSSLHPAGPAAEHIAWLWWILLAVCTPVFMLVVVLTLLAIWRRPGSSRPSEPLGNRFIVICAIILPAIILFFFLFVSLEAMVTLEEPEEVVTIRVVGHQFWWEVHYPDHGIETANEIHIPVGAAVRLELQAADVLHSFWVPNLAGKRDLLAEHPNTFWIQADRPGTYRGQCAEYCGVQHALMAFYVVALPAEEFRAWLEEKQQPRPEPANEELARGREVFFQRGCNNCHAIQGTSARANVGPDLTHFGSRLSIGAGTLPNNHGNLAGWIVDPQAAKPGNRMPRSYLPADELHLLLDYLMSLQ